MSEPERDLVGYGANRPTTGFPDGKRLAIFVSQSRQGRLTLRPAWALGLPQAVLS